jgi:hypothetical protein
MKYILGLLFFLCAGFGFSDVTAYSDIREIRIESENYYIIHYHNWSEETRHERYIMVTSQNQDIFHNNNYAYIEIISKKINEKIIRVPSPALTHLYISEDEQYIIGISNIMIDNPYQLVILNIDGEILKKRHIAQIEARMNENDFNSFRRNFSNAFQYLQLNERIYNINSYYYIDFVGLNLSAFFGNEILNFLLKYRTVNHLSENIWSSVTNWIFWFNENNPNVSFNYRDNKLFSINIFDQENVLMEIFIDESG